MTRRHIHYELAFEDYLRCLGLAYISVDQAKKAIFAGAKIKSFDFLVYTDTGDNRLIDVKGRRFPYAAGSSRRYWENWVTQADLDGLTRWQEVFGPGYTATIVFAYWLSSSSKPGPLEPLHSFAGRDYSFLEIPLLDYKAHARPRSTRWTTLSVPAKIFRQLARPFAAQ